MALYDIPDGANYAWIIEHAICHAGKFVLMLSENAVESIWVGKELKRAITLFQQKSTKNLCTVWLNHTFPLSETPLAIPLEDIQINVDLEGNTGNHMMIVDSEQYAKDRAAEYNAEIERLLSPACNTEILQEVLEHIRAIAKHDMHFLLKHGDVYNLYELAKREIDLMNESAHIYDGKYLSHHGEALYLISRLWKKLQ